MFHHKYFPLQLFIPHHFQPIPAWLTHSRKKAIHSFAHLPFFALFDVFFHSNNFRCIDQKPFFLFVQFSLFILQWPKFSSNFFISSNKWKTMIDKPTKRKKPFALQTMNYYFVPIPICWLEYWRGIRHVLNWESMTWSNIEGNNPLGQFWLFLTDSIPSKTFQIYIDSFLPFHFRFASFPQQKKHKNRQNWIISVNSFKMAK